MTDYNQIEIAKQIIEELIQKMGVEAKVEYEESITKGLIFNISSYDSYLLIGRQGATLQSLQTLAQALVLKKLSSASGEPLWFSLDVDDYKRKREWFLKETAQAAVEHIKKTGRGVALEPMPNYERRLVHAYLQERYPEAESSSIGEEPRRKVVIRLKR
jgi:spoIIIJ-associated protein